VVYGLREEGLIRGHACARRRTGRRVAGVPLDAHRKLSGPEFSRRQAAQGRPDAVHLVIRHRPVHVPWQRASSMRPSLRLPVRMAVVKSSKRQRPSPVSSPGVRFAGTAMPAVSADDRYSRARARHRLNAAGGRSAGHSLALPSAGRATRFTCFGADAPCDGGERALGARLNRCLPNQRHMANSRPWDRRMTAPLEFRDASTLTSCQPLPSPASTSSRKFSSRQRIAPLLLDRPA